mgnify:CR=1 FL=1
MGLGVSFGLWGGDRAGCCAHDMDKPTEGRSQPPPVGYLFSLCFRVCLRPLPHREQAFTDVVGRHEHLVGPRVQL